MSICVQKINFIPPFYLEMSKQHCKPVISGALGMPGYGHHKQLNQLVENVDVYLLTKNQIYPSPIS